MVPPWVPDAPRPADGDSEEDESQQQSPAGQSMPAAPQQPIPIAPAGRFAPARTNLGQYAHSGSFDEMRRGIGHYVGKGLGGSGIAVRRFGGTASTAGSLYGTLSSAAAGQAAAPGSPFDPALLRARTAREIINAVVEAVRPIDGTQDAEASRTAICDALAELLNQFPDADLLNLSEEQRIFAIEQYLAIDVFIRFHLDVGQMIQARAATASAALVRLKDVKDYIKQIIAASFRKVRTAGSALSGRRITELARQALSDAFRVFEDYVR